MLTEVDSIMLMSARLMVPLCTLLLMERHMESFMQSFPKKIKARGLLHL
jgi:hypothetical protein